MEELIQKLKDAGCDTDETIKRFLGKKDFMIKCMGKAIVDKDFEKLGEALDKKNIEEAFKYSHGLKGVLLNVGFNPIYEDIMVIVERLREGTCDECVINAYKKLLDDKEKISEILKKG